MGTISSFTFLTLNGYFEGPEPGNINWHRHGKEENAFAESHLKSQNSILLFGRKTYEMMAGYWPTPMAFEHDPEVAQGMNDASKLVFSNSLKTPKWQNTHAISGDIVKKVRKMKEKENQTMTILGSASIVRLFTEAGLIDYFAIMIDPVILGKGNTLFTGLHGMLKLKLESGHQLSSGVLLLNYIPMP